MSRTFLKPVVDAAALLCQRAEHAARGNASDVVLDAFPRHVQLDGYSCGAQSAHMILRYFNKARSVSRTTSKLGTDEDGTSWTQMKRLFRARGLTTTRIDDARKRDIHVAVDTGSPLVVSLDDGGHWGVVYGYGPGRVYLADPSLWAGRSVVTSWGDFKGRWDRWAAVVKVSQR